MPRPAPAPVDARLADLLRPLVEASGHVLEDVRTTPAGKRRVVRVVVDLPEDRTGSLDLDAVALVSREVADALDDSDVLGGSAYVLEVTSPGVDRPLTERRHWARARGRLATVAVAPADGEPAASLTGRVLAVGDDGVELATDGATRTVPWDRLGTGRVQVEFSRPGEDHLDEADDSDDEIADDEIDDDEADETDEPDETDEEV